MSAHVVSVKHSTVIVQLTEPLDEDQHLIVTQSEPLPKQFVSGSAFEMTSLNASRTGAGHQKPVMASASSL